jgi:hypothetical protein
VRGGGGEKDREGWRREEGRDEQGRNRDRDEVRKVGGERESGR